VNVQRVAEKPQGRAVAILEENLQKIPSYSRMSSAFPRTTA